MSFLQSFQFQVEDDDQCSTCFEICPMRRENRITSMFFRFDYGLKFN